MGDVSISSLARPSLLVLAAVVASLGYKQCHPDNWYCQHPFYFLFLANLSPHDHWYLPSSLSWASVSCISRPNPGSSPLRIRFRLIHAVSTPFGWLNSSLRSHPQQPITCTIQGYMGSYAKFAASNAFMAKKASKYPMSFHQRKIRGS